MCSYEYYYKIGSLDARVEIELHPYDGRRRNDIRVIGSASRGRVTRVYDVKVYTSMASNAHCATTIIPAVISYVDQY